ncbi:MAG: metallophosphoesterase [Simkaniaceae bacterium]|nr:metallophosphoesterase [Simkaniaceae bacterium]
MQPLKLLLAVLYTTWVSDPTTTLTEVDKGSYVTKKRSEPAFTSGTLRFCVAGDCYGSSYETYQRACHQIALEKPDFIVLGGDLAYTVGLVKPLIYIMPSFIRWKYFFKALPPGIPLLVAPGNHDVNGKTGPFYTYFPQLHPTYQSLTWNQLLSLYLLDTGHGYPIEGDQTAFLKEQLEHCKTQWKLAVYHVPAYPARHPNDPTTQKIRALWVPLFDTYHLDIAFEHHSHTYKKTFPLKSGNIDVEGTYYLGDGCLSVSPHSAKDLPYIEESGAYHFFYVVTLTETRCLVERVLLDGRRKVTVELFKKPSHNDLLQPAS